MSASNTGKAVLRSGKQLKEQQKDKSKSSGRRKAKSTDSTPKSDADAYLNEHLNFVEPDSEFEIPIQIEPRTASSAAAEVDTGEFESSDFHTMSLEKDNEIQRLKFLLEQAKENLDREKLEKLELAKFYEDRKHEEGKETPTVILDSGSSVPIPKFDANKMTPESFLIEVEEYLAWKNASKETWIFLVSRMFAKDSDISRWWRETKQTVKTWDQFKESFLKYEKSGASKDELLAKLFATRQKLSDAFETFAWDVNGNYRKIDSAIPVSEVIQRILNSCLPEISVILRNFTYQSVAELIFKAREVIHDLNKVRSFEGKQALRSKSSDPVETRQQHYNRNERRGWRKSEEFVQSRDREQTQTRETKEENSNSQGKDSQIPQQQSGLISSQQQQPDSAPYRRTGVSGSQNTRKPISCFYCHILGHKEADCNTKNRDERLKTQIAGNRPKPNANQEN
jgi:hypothetical protein